MHLLPEAKEEALASSVPASSFRVSRVYSRQTGCVSDAAVGYPLPVGLFSVQDPLLTIVFPDPGRACARVMHPRPSFARAMSLSEQHLLPWNLAVPFSGGP